MVDGEGTFVYVNMFGGGVAWTRFEELRMRSQRRKTCGIVYIYLLHYDFLPYRFEGRSDSVLHPDLCTWKLLKNIL